MRKLLAVLVIATILFSPLSPVFAADVPASANIIEQFKEWLDKDQESALGAITRLERMVGELFAALTDIEARLAVLEERLHIDHGHENDEHACLHMAHGPAQSMLLATATTTAGSADVTPPHTRFDLSFPSGEGEILGYAAFTVSEDAMYAFYISTSTPFGISASDDTMMDIELEAVEGQANCAPETIRHTADLPPGIYILHFGPSDAQEIHLAIEQSEEQHDHTNETETNTGNTGNTGGSGGGSENSNNDSGVGGNAAFDPELDEHACLHVVHGPSRTVTASANQTHAPDVSRAHTRFDISLTGEGYTSYTADEAVDYVFYLTKNIPFSVFNAAGSQMLFEVYGANVQQCPQAAVKHLVPLNQGTYSLKFDASNESLVGLVVEKSEHEHEQEQNANSQNNSQNNTENNTQTNDPSTDNTALAPTNNPPPTSTTSTPALNATHEPAQSAVPLTIPEQSTMTSSAEVSTPQTTLASVHTQNNDIVEEETIDEYTNDEEADDTDAKISEKESSFFQTIVQRIMTIIRKINEIKNKIQEIMWRLARIEQALV